MQNLRVVEAIEKFQGWSSPWEFLARVSTFPSLNDTDRASLEEVWQVATASDLWSGTLEQGTLSVEMALAAEYPWLSARAREQLVRGASYQWR
jgi:hypothetical protein